MPLLRQIGRLLRHGAVGPRLLGERFSQGHRELSVVIYFLAFLVGYNISRWRTDVTGFLLPVSVVRAERRFRVCVAWYNILVGWMGGCAGVLLWGRRHNNMPNARKCHGRRRKKHLE